ncbi:hypothetical protein [Lactiplantibacillus paraxiangfangensis]|uniref:hypothetical protein n=1 Tax=Lactiplantibacillus paraxiangfangensis TaxID=3076224 RepID=UPI0030C7603B
MAAGDYTDPKWDTADVVILIDSKQPELYATGDVFTATYDSDNVTISADIKGHGITVINHNGSATVTVNVSALDTIWHDFLVDHDPGKGHTIDIMTPVEHLHTNSAHLVKMPDMNSGNEAPTRALQFKTPTLVAEPAA